MNGEMTEGDCSTCQGAWRCKWLWSHRKTAWRPIVSRGLKVPSCRSVLDLVVARSWWRKAASCELTYVLATLYRLVQSIVIATQTLPTMSDSPDGNVPAAPCASVTTPSFFDAVIDFGSNSTRAAWYDADVKMWEPFKMWENGNKKEDELPSVAIIEKKTGEVLHIGFEARMMTVSSPQQVYKKSIKSDFGGNPNTRRGNAFQQFVSDVVRDFTNNLHTKLEKNQTFRLTTSTPVLWSRLHLNTFEYAIREGMKLGLDQGSEVDVHIIHEPACAGLARNIGSFMAHRSFQDGDRLCVCDFGGTTIVRERCMF